MRDCGIVQSINSQLRIPQSRISAISQFLVSDNKVMNERDELIEQKSRMGRLLEKRRTRVGLIWGIWTVVALFFSTQVYMMYYDTSCRPEC